MPATIDKSDVQGLVRTAFNAMTRGCYSIVRIEDAAAARRWLAEVLPLVNDARTSDEGGDPAQNDRALQMAFSWEGLRKLGVPAATAEGFSLEFQFGMTGEKNRSRRLGDVGSDAPEKWAWGGTGGGADAVMLLFTKGDLDQWKATVQGAGWSAAFHELACLDTASTDRNDTEPFGFRDGLSQPKMDWKLQRKPEGEELEFSNLIAAGEFLLGYPNEYGKLTERPMIDDRDDPKRILHAAEGTRGLRDFGLNGTYLVFRDLAQDVRGFWKFLDAQSDGDRAKREHLGALTVGRTLDGTPLVPPSPHPIPGIEPAETMNHFTYDSDPTGVRCPIGAHVRRANPRVADLPPGSRGLWDRLLRTLGFGSTRPDEDLVSSARFHRILRRGREYGPELRPDEAARQTEPDGQARGLRFVCLNANITRQFEFVQQAWSMASKFSGLTDQSDPILGNRAPLQGCLTTSTFSIPQSSGLARCIQDVPQFVGVRGGGYFFLPSIRALRYIAAIGT